MKAVREESKMRQASKPGVRWRVSLWAIFKFGFRLWAKGTHRKVSGSVGACHQVGSGNINSCYPVGTGFVESGAVKRNLPWPQW